MPAPRKYPDELRERSVRLVSEAMAEDRSLSLNAAVNRIGPRVGLGSSGRRNTYLMESVAMTRRGRKRNLEKERLYWDLLASGLGTVQACRQS